MSDFTIIAGIYDRSSTVHKHGAVLRYDAHEIDYSMGELDRLRAMKLRKAQKQSVRNMEVLTLLGDIGKICKECGQPKSLEDDYYAGHTTYCKDCMRRKARERKARTRQLIATGR